MATFLAILNALPALIQSLPELFRIILKLIALTESLIAWSKQKAVEDWLSELEETIDKAIDAKTPEQKRDVARSLVGIIRKFK